jgi:hypothetical protein
MIGREFTKRIRLLYGRHETIKTRYELSESGLVEHVVLETFDRPTHTASDAPSVASGVTPGQRPS